MLRFKHITSKFLAFSFALVMLFFANHCFLEEACASLGKVDLGGHPISADGSKDSPCHEHSEDSHETDCPILGITLQKSLSSLEAQDFLKINFRISLWFSRIYSDKFSLNLVLKESNDPFLLEDRLNSLTIILKSAPQAPPILS